MTREEIQWELDHGVDPVDWIKQLTDQIERIVTSDCRAMMIIDKSGKIDWSNYPTKEEIKKEIGK